MCLQLLQHSFRDWTKPPLTTLILGMVYDLTRSKSELVAENAFLRKPRIIPRRQVIQPACTKKGQDDLSSPGVGGSYLETKPVHSHGRCRLSVGSV
jgi:hypothetical protein